MENNNIIVITGSIGSGKTTFMRLLSKAFKTSQKKVLELDEVDWQDISKLIHNVKNTNILITTIDYDTELFPVKCDRVIEIRRS